MAKINEVRVDFGLSQATGPNSWIKASAGITIEFEDGDHDKKDEIWQAAWDRVTEEVAKQLQMLQQNS